jgi:hypothetical protein
MKPPGSARASAHRSRLFAPGIMKQGLKGQDIDLKTAVMDRREKVV